MSAIKHRLLAYSDHLSKIIEQNPGHPQLGELCHAQAIVLIELHAVEKKGLEFDLATAAVSAGLKQVNETMANYIQMLKHEPVAEPKKPVDIEPKTEQTVD